MKSILIISALLILTSCGARRSGWVGPAGKDGTNGINGVNGTNGIDGKSCHVETLGNGARIYCDDGSQSVVLNGEEGLQGATGSSGHDGIDGIDGTNGTNGHDGQNGTNGTNGISPVLTIVDPCGDNPSQFDEVLIKTDSGYLAYFEEGSKRYLAKLSVGSYRTTDSQSCNFTVNANGTITDLLGTR